MGHRANHFLLRESVRDYKVSLDYSFTQLTLFDECEKQLVESTPDSSCGKTCLVPLTHQVEMILEPCLKRSQKLKFQCLQTTNGLTQGWFNATDVKLLGDAWMLNIGVSPNVEIVCGLSQILQSPADVPKKYYLSSRAAAGIIRRAKERKKELPEALRIALEMQSRYGNEPESQVAGKVPCLQ